MEPNYLGCVGNWPPTIPVKYTHLFISFQKHIGKVLKKCPFQSSRSSDVLRWSWKHPCRESFGHGKNPRYWLGPRRPGVGFVAWKPNEKKKKSPLWSLPYSTGCFRWFWSRHLIGARERQRFFSFTSFSGSLVGSCSQCRPLKERRVFLMFLDSSSRSWAWKSIWQRRRSRFHGQSHVSKRICTSTKLIL